MQVRVEFARNTCIFEDSRLSFILAMASVVGLTGHQFLGAYLEQGSQQLVFITIVHRISKEIEELFDKAKQEV